MKKLKDIFWNFIKPKRRQAKKYEVIFKKDIRNEEPISGTFEEVMTALKNKFGNVRISILSKAIEIRGI